MKILFFGTDDQFGLCPSYLRAAAELNIEHEFFDYQKSIVKNIKYGKLGLLIHQHLNPENWVHKINRHFVVQAKNYKPDLVFTFTNAPITPAAIIFLKSILPGCRFVLVWPDSLLNFKQQTINTLGLYDYIASYGSTSVNILSRISKTKVGFIPLAGDLKIHGVNPQDITRIDLGFVGSWNPERQHSLETIQAHFSNLKIEIYGPRWKDRCKNSILRDKIKGDGLHGMKMAEFFNSCRINLNKIDDTNFPSANMRFFEILAAGGLELVSACPEMEQVFVDRQDLLYFHDEASLVTQIQWVLSNPGKLNEIKNRGHAKIVEEHNYTNRLKTILNQLS